MLYLQKMFKSKKFREELKAYNKERNKQMPRPIIYGMTGMPTVHIYQLTPAAFRMMEACGTISRLR